MQRAALAMGLNENQNLNRIEKGHGKHGKTGKENSNAKHC
jgi:hypothetical protein